MKKKALKAIIEEKQEALNTERVNARARKFERLEKTIKRTVEDFAEHGEVETSREISSGTCMNSRGFMEIVIKVNVEA